MPKNPDDILEVPSTDTETTLVELEAKDDSNGKDFLTINELEEYVDEMLNSLPKLNRRKLRQELENMVVPVKANPHTSDLNEGLSVAQGYKDRLAEIYLLAQREHRTRNRCMEMLVEAYMTISKQSSADKRKGEANLRYAVRLLQLQAAENFMKEVEHIIANVKSAMDAVSRQISLYDIQLKIGDVRRGSSNQGQAEERTTNGQVDWTDF